MSVDTINPTELRAALAPIERELARARQDVLRAIQAASSAERGPARESRFAELRRARARRDAYRRVICAVEQLCVQIEGPSWL